MEKYFISDNYFEDRKVSSTVEDVKRAIIDFLNREYEDNHTYEDFDILYPDLKHVGIAYTNTPDENHEIQFEINLEDFTASQLVDNKEISRYDYVKENKNIEQALECMKSEIENGYFSAFVSVDEDELRNVLGLEIDDNGNFYDLLVNDLDNDYFETTYNIEINNNDMKK